MRNLLSDWCTLVAVAMLIVSWVTVQGEISSDTQALMYLQKFGYMNESSKSAAMIDSKEAMLTAVKDFQRFAGIHATGVLDNETIKMMNTPRCGVKDKVGHSDSARRRKRYALQGSKWRVTDLTYRISKYPSRLKEKLQVDKEIEKAFKVWSDMTPLNFIAKKSGRVHIDIRFEAGEHGDGDPFDGPSQTLAHAFFPQYGGDCHFDDEEKWTINSYRGTNLFMVAAHEFGHSLGLSHSDIKSSLMAPFYHGFDPNFKLDEDDITGIRALYGSRKSTKVTPDIEKPKKNSGDSGDAPDLCQSSAIDAVTRTADGTTYVFKSNYYWRIMSDGIADGYPRSIKDDWDGLPGDLDAALTWSDGKTFFFKGGSYWRFTNKKADPGYPKDINTGFKGIPNDIDAALLWSGNGKTYFFKGDKYWRFDSRSDNPVSDRYPKPISGWEGLPNNIQACFQWENGRTYFFKESNYYRFNDNEFAVEKASPPYPRSTAVWWFDCKSMSGKRNPDFRSGLEEGDKPTISITTSVGDASMVMAKEDTNSSDDSVSVDGNDDMDSSRHHDDEEPNTPKAVMHKGQMDYSHSGTGSIELAICLVLSIIFLRILQKG